MDTSKQYIKMCDCEEVQGEWTIPPYPGDYFEYGVVTVYWTGYKPPDDFDDSIFLPRQDQIQEWMNYCFWDVMLEDFIEFYDGGYVSEIGFLSMEQFWLAFYMHEKHGKVWNGEEWAKSDGAKGLGKVSKESPSTVTRER